MSALPAICRDCLEPDPPGSRCPKCASPRIVRHAELRTLSVAHLDCDAFYAAIEKRDDPSLRDVPLIVGGGRRGVVSTACYIARTCGVRSAMPMFKALKACPDAVVVKPDMEKYARVGREVRALMLELTPLVEPLSIDEAFLDLSGTERLHGHAPADSLARLARRIETEVGITASIGLAPNKFLAKIASDLDKPRGFSVIGREEAVPFLARQPVGLIWGVGKAMQARLAGEGIRTIADLQKADRTDLARRFGATGLRLHALAHGRDERRVDPDGARKSVSAETTFNDDISDAEALTRYLWVLSEKVSARLKASSIAGRTVTLKLKGDDFRTVTRAETLSDPTRLADRIFRTARAMLEPLATGRRYRLIGVGVSDLSAADLADPDDLVDRDAGKRARAEFAIDKVRDRFGRDSVGKGLGFPPRKRGTPA
ncbi:MAG: DNA polymerase IV [Flavobacteriaceae bacterium]